MKTIFAATLDQAGQPSLSRGHWPSLTSRVTSADFNTAFIDFDLTTLCCKAATESVNRMKWVRGERGLGSDGAHQWIVFLCQNNFSSHVTPWRTVLHSALMQGGFHHGVDAGKNTIDSERIFIIYLTFSVVFRGHLFTTSFRYTYLFEAAMALKRTRWDFSLTVQV